MNRFTVRDSAEEINVQESWLSCRMKAVLSVKAASKSRLHAVLFPYLKMRPIPQYEIEEKICIVIDIRKNEIWQSSVQKYCAANSLQGFLLLVQRSRNYEEESKWNSSE